MPRLTLEEKEKKLLQKLREVKREKARLRAQKELKIAKKEETDNIHQRIYELHLKDFWDYRAIAKKLNYHPVYVNKIINKAKRERATKY